MALTTSDNEANPEDVIDLTNGTPPHLKLVAPWQIEDSSWSTSTAEGATDPASSTDDKKSQKSESKTPINPTTRDVLKLPSSSEDDELHKSESKSENNGTTAGLNPDIIRLLHVRKTDEGHDIWLNQTVLTSVVCKLFREVVNNCLP